MAELKIEKPGAGRYTVSFDTEGGRVTCELSGLDSSLDGGDGSAERHAALKRAKRLVKAFYEAIPG